MKNKNGISLIILVITIVVIIILATAVIVSFTTNNPIKAANEAKFKSDIDAFKTELDLYKSNKFIGNIGRYDEKTLNADKAMMEEMGQTQPGKTMFDTIPSMKNTRYDKDGLLKVVKGELVYIGNDEDEKEWAGDSGLTVENAKLDILEILTTTTINSSELDVKLIQKMPRQVNYEVQISEDNGTTYTVKEHTRKDSTDGSNGAVILIENLKNEKAYKVKVIATDEKANRSEKIVDISTVAIEKPEITATPTTWTNGNVTATITYPNVAGTTREYSYDGTNWTAYSGLTETLTITENKTVYARVTDSTNQTSVQATKSIDNIDKEAPTVSNFTYTVTTDSISITGVTVTETLSRIDKYIHSIPGTWTNDPGITTPTATIPNLQAGTTYTVEVKVKDVAGNIGTKIISIETELPPISTEEYASKNRTIDGNAPSYSNPIIPKGFKAVNIDSNANRESIEPILLEVGTKTPGAASTGYASSWKNVSTDYDRGLVIEDSSNNQFVWIPAAKYGYLAHYGGNTATDTIGSGINEQTQINNYGGFWVGRYEAYNNSGNAASMQDKSSWVSIAYSESKTKSENFATNYGHSKTYFESSLLTGKMWDTILKFIASDGTDVNTDSALWGNYLNTNVTSNNGTILKTAGTSQVLSTGVTNYTNRKNIYDIAGNFYEWTNEVVSSNRVICGGDYHSNANNHPASYRAIIPPINANIYYGFRIALFVK